MKPEDRQETLSLEREASFATANEVLLAPYALDANRLETVFGQILAHKVDYADLYFQYTRSEGWSLEEGIVKSGSFNIDQGVGVRAVSGEKTAFAYSDDISLTALDSGGAGDARHRAPGRSPGARRLRRRAAGHNLYAPHDPLASLEDRPRSRCSSASNAVRADSTPRVTQVMASLGRRIRSGAGRAQRRRARGRRAAAGAAVAAGDRRAGRPPRAGQRGRRRAFRLRLFHRRDAAGLRGQGGRPGARSISSASRRRRAP